MITTQVKSRFHFYNPARTKKRNRCQKFFYANKECGLVFEENGRLFINFEEKKKEKRKNQRKDKVKENNIKYINKQYANNPYAKNSYFTRGEKEKT